MGWIEDFETWTKKGTSVDDLLKKVEAKSPYLVGKEGMLPDWKIKGKPIGEVFSVEGYKAGGEWWRKAITTRGGEFFGGLLGTGGTEGRGLVETVKEESGYSDAERWFAKKSEDVDRAQEDALRYFREKSGQAGGLVQVDMPKIEIPTLDLSPFAAGLAAMGAGIGGGLGGIPQMPQMPSLTDEDGEPNLVMIAALAAVGLGGVYLISKR